MSCMEHILNGDRNVETLTVSSIQKMSPKATNLGNNKIEPSPSQTPNPRREKCGFARRKRRSAQIDLELHQINDII
ncbi:hypothetical protein Fmac_008232 [Flemingia macrophylla]|uniref:Uncharacterized protein n=1 Tax=Flemingia macrophylla TaxID=520843 RepID=A0ABD1MXN9_9FABA